MTAGVADGLEEAFFASDSPTVSVAVVDADTVEIAPRVDDLRKWTPEARARRARFAAYVRVAIALCGALCVAAAGRNVLSAREHDDAPRRVVAVVPPVAGGPVAPAQHSKTDPTRELEPASSSEVSSAATVPSVDRDAAAREKRVAQRALEMGRVAAAIGAGERSVSLDPSDGESWLILGAAYLELGQANDARRCFRACVAEARRGPKWECGAMLR